MIISLLQNNSYSNFLFFVFIYVGAVDAAYVLEQVELQIARVKEEALGRKEILEKVEKWKAACEEESWLEEYNRVGCFYILHWAQIDLNLCSCLLFCFLM